MTTAASAAVDIPPLATPGASTRRWPPVLMCFALFALYWETRELVRTWHVPVPVETVTELARAGELAEARVVGSTVLVARKATADPGFGARLRESLGLPYDRRWLAVQPADLAALVDTLHQAGVRVVAGPSLGALGR